MMLTPLLAIIIAVNYDSYCLMNAIWRWTLKLINVYVQSCHHYRRLSTVSDQTFPVAAARAWNNMPHHITSTSSLPVLRARLKTYLFSLSFPW